MNKSDVMILAAEALAISEENLRAFLAARYEPNVINHYVGVVKEFAKQYENLYTSGSPRWDGRPAKRN